MAKIFGLNGVLSGRQGYTVFAVRNGVNIARKYQPIVSNPKSASQVEGRAKLKLLSQLSAVLGSNIAIPREGDVSPRNIFTKVNYPAVSYAGNQAQITLENVKITRSAVGLSRLIASREGNVLSVSLSNSENSLDAVMYVLVNKRNNNSIAVLASSSVPKGSDAHFPTTFPADPSEECVVYAYGIRNNTEKARVAYGNLTSAPAEAFAKLITSRVLTSSDVTLTETRGLLVNVGS